jgi:hypothetical protein
MLLLNGKAGKAYNVCNSSLFVSITELAEILTSLYPKRWLKVIRNSEHYTENVMNLKECEKTESTDIIDMRIDLP